MFSLLFAIGSFVGVTWVVAVVGTVFLGHTVDRRSAPYRPDIPLSLFERPLVGWLLQLVRALGRPRLWASGLVHAVWLLGGRDPIEEMSEEDVEAQWSVPRAPPRLEAWRRLGLDVGGDEGRDAGAPNGAGRAAKPRAKRRARRATNKKAAASETAVRKTATGERESEGDTKRRRKR
jgi:hypothetical protein